MQNPVFTRLLALFALAAGACTEAPVSPYIDAVPSFAKGGGGGRGGGSSAQPADFTLPDGGADLVGDGKGVYANGVCGVIGSWADIAYLAPAGGKIARSQKAACADVAPRRLTLTLGVRHVSDDPHVDDTASPTGGGVFDVEGVKFGRLDALDPSATGVVNVAGMCIVGTGPTASWVGLRFNATNYPGSSDLLQDDLGGGTWRFHTRPWPDNLAHCGEGDGVGLWHVDLDVVAATGG